MTETIVEQKPEAVETPVVETPPAPEQSIDDLLAQYDREVPTPEPATDNTGTPTLDEQIADLLGPDPTAQLTQQNSELQSQVDSLRAEAHRAQEFQAFQDEAKSLQDQLPPWLPDGYAELKLKALAHDPTIAAAFDYRAVDKAAARAELIKVQFALNQPGLDPAQVQQLQQYGARLEIAVNSAAILRQAKLGILNEANRLPPPIDAEATALKQEIAFHMKGASSKRIAEPPPNFGRMTDNEFRQWKRENLGWE